MEYELRTLHPQHILVTRYSSLVTDQKKYFFGKYDQGIGASFFWIGAEMTW